MGIFDIFSKRQKRLENAGKRDIYQYDTLPTPFRTQVLHIWRTAFGKYYVPGEFSHASSSPANQFWIFLHDTLARELGLGVLAGDQYAAGILVRLDSQFAHAEIVTPALSLLNAAGFDGPADEFIRAFDHYRHGRNKEAVSEALKSFESTMKAICAVRKWPHPTNATAIPLIKVIFEKGLIPKDLESHFSGLRSAMESGLPTISNKTSRHGQSPEPTTIPPHFAAYALHLLASNIVFLVEA